jgi:hypothetical protein
MAEHAGAGVHEGVPGIGRDDDHVAGLGVEVGALDLVAGLAVVEDEDLITPGWADGQGCLVATVASAPKPGSKFVAPHS